MIMGLGCGVPAMVNTRTLNSDKERIKTIRVIPYFTCGAKADILAAVSASVALSFGWNADLFTMGMYVMGFVMAVVVVILMNKTTQREEVPPFIMELPAYHMPQPKAVAIHVWDKGKHFLKKAGTIILISTIVITMMENLTWDWRFIPAFEEATLEEIQALGYASYEAMEASSMLSSLGKVIMPLFTPIGFGTQLNSTGWIFGVATIQGIVAKENVTGTLTALAGIVGQNVEGLEDGDAVSQMFAATGITAGGIMGFTVFNLLTIPCFASVGTAKGELPTKKSYIGTILFWLLGAYVIASLFYLFTDAVVGNFGLVAGIIVPIVIVAAVVGTFFLAHLYDKKMRAKEALAA
jgi:ferrous iron transport protein B